MFCIWCKHPFYIGEPLEEYQERVKTQEREEKENEKHLFEEREKLRKREVERLRQIKIKMKSNPVVRSTDYLNHLRNGGFPTKSGLSNKAHIYVLKLNQPEGKFLHQHRFPNQEFPVLVQPGEPGFMGFVYVGHTQRVPNHKIDLKEFEGDPVLFRFYKEHLTGEGGSKVVTKYHSSKDFEKCGRDLTERYGFKNVSITKPNQGEVESYKLESWVGFMLYKLGYWVWGPHLHSKDRKEEFGDFLGKGIYL
jgi:hypothetical protein